MTHDPNMHVHDLQADLWPFCNPLDQWVLVSCVILVVQVPSYRYTVALLHDLWWYLQWKHCCLAVSMKSLYTREIQCTCTSTCSSFIVLCIPCFIHQVIGVDPVGSILAEPEELNKGGVSGYQVGHSSHALWLGHPIKPSFGAYRCILTSKLLVWLSILGYVGQFNVHSNITNQDRACVSLSSLTLVVTLTC